MKNFKTVTKIFFGILFFSQLAFAENVISEKKATGPSAWFPNAFSNALLLNFQTKKTNKSFKGLSQARLYLGSTFFNDFITSQVVFGVSLSADSYILTDRGTRFETFFDLYSNDFYTLEPYVEVKLPATGASNIQTVFGLNQELSHTFETQSGDFSLKTAYYFEGHFGSEQSQTSIKGSKKFSPQKRATLTNLITTKKGKLVSKQASPNFEHELSFGVKWKTAFLDGFSVGVKRYMLQEGSPVMVEDTTLNKIREAKTSFLNLSKYKLDKTNYNRLRLSYSLPSKTAFTVDTYLYDSLNVVIVSSISTKLF